MDFKEYQERANATNLGTAIGGYKFVYAALGLSGEAGEISEKIKKLFRDLDGNADDQFKRSIKKELGDVLWYISQLAQDFDFTLEDVAHANLDKIESRKRNNHLHGDGDNR